MQITFKRKPVPIPADYRPLYKIALILLILERNSRGKKASLMKLHLFSWAIKSSLSQERLINALESNDLPEFWSFEPSLNRALTFAEAENLCEVVNKKNYRITSKGKEFLDKVVESEDVFKDEKEFLSQIGLKVGETLIQNTIKKWNKYHA